MTLNDVLPLCGKPQSPPRGWAAVTPSADPFSDTASNPNTNKVARVLLFVGAGSVTFKTVDGVSTTMTLDPAWVYPVLLPGMFTHVTAASGTTVYAGWF